MKFNKKQQALFDKLTSLQQCVVLAKVADPSISDVEAYRRGGGKATSDGSARKSANDILTNLNVVNFLATTSVTIVKSSIMSREELLENLTDIIKSNSENAKKLRPSDQIAAMKLLVEMQGYNAPVKTENITTVRTLDDFYDDEE